MQGLHYRAIDASGRVHTGYANSASVSELDEWICQRGWQPLPTSMLQRLANVLRLRSAVVRWSASSAALFTLNFSHLFSAGVPLLSVMEELIALERQASVKRALQAIHHRIEQGSGLSDAFALFPGMFGGDYIASIKAGERSGKLAECLQLQAINLRWQADLAQRLKTVLIYPLFALVCLVAVFLFVLLYLVPAMQPLLAMSEAPLPMHTQWLLSLSNYTRHGGPSLLLLISIPAALALVLLPATAPLGYWFRARLLQAPYGQILSGFTLARYARTTGLLYESGIEITEAMSIGQRLLSNVVLRQQLHDAQQLVLKGSGIGVAMQSQKALPTLFVRMIIAGESAGVLGVALRQCADQLQANAQYALDRVERLLGPVLLCLMGALLLWVVMSVLGPLYDAVNQGGVLR